MKSDSAKQRITLTSRESSKKHESKLYGLGNHPHTDGLENSLSSYLFS